MFFWSQELLHQSVLSRYTYLGHFSCYWGQKKPHLLRQNPNVLSYHVVASVICQFLWCELSVLERKLIFFLYDGISYAFIISMRCSLHCQQLLVVAMFPVLFLKSLSILQMTLLFENLYLTFAITYLQMLKLIPILLIRLSYNFSDASDITLL